jgi:hypothetical protein
MQSLIHEDPNFTSLIYPYASRCPTETCLAKAGIMGVSLDQQHDVHISAGVKARFGDT